MSVLEDYYTNVYLNRANELSEQSRHRKKAYEAEMKLRELLKSDGVELLETLVNEITDTASEETKRAFIDGCKVGADLAEILKKGIDF